MKKVLSVILAVFTALAVTACSEENGSLSDNPGNDFDSTLPQCEPANLPDAGNLIRQCIMKGEDGFYYTDMTMLADKNVTRALCYYDMTTQTSIPLCAKPQCMHDGNDFCVATGGGAYSFYGSLTALYNGCIYRLGADSSDAEEWKLSLLRTDLQGNELSEVATICTFKTSEDSIKPQIASALFHCGKLFAAVSDMENNAKTTLYVADIASGDVRTINMPSPEEGVTEAIGATCSDMIADGEWLYYTMRHVKEDKYHFYFEYDRTMLYRYNVRTGVTENIPAMPDIYSSFTVVHDIIYYTTVDTSNNTFSLYSYDIKKDKTEALSEKVQQECLKGEYLYQQDKVTVCTDRSYLYVCTNGMEGQYVKDNGLQSDVDFYIYDMEGKELLHGLTGMKPDSENYSYGFSAIDGTIYFNLSDYDMTGEELTGLYTVNTEDLINGKTDWTKLYVLHQYIA
ncbi:MAG: hypothetical protein IJZ51_00660 [Ruminiclostridium sp.]|nr:hypothetical protein [Ruminiclostridium sp.]